MGETIVITRLFVMTLISLIVNSILSLSIGTLSLLEVFLYVLSFNSYSRESFFLFAAIFYFVLFGFNIAYSVVIIIGSILGSSYRDRNRKIGVVLLIVINTILVPLFVANLGYIIKGFTITRYYQGFSTTPAIVGIVVSVCLCCVFVWNIIPIVVICKSLRWIYENRQAEEYQGNELTEV